MCAAFPTKRGRGNLSAVYLHQIKRSDMCKSFLHDLIQTCEWSFKPNTPSPGLTNNRPMSMAWNPPTSGRSSPAVPAADKTTQRSCCESWLKRQQDLNVFPGHHGGNPNDATDTRSCFAHDNPDGGPNLTNGELSISPPPRRLICVLNDDRPNFI